MTTAIYTDQTSEGALCLAFEKHGDSLCEDNATCPHPLSDLYDSVWEAVSKRHIYSRCTCAERLAEELGFDDVDALREHADRVAGVVEQDEEDADDDGEEWRERPVTALPSVGHILEKRLKAAGYETVEDVAHTEPADLVAEVDGLGAGTAREIGEHIGELMGKSDTVIEMAGRRIEQQIEEEVS